mmetsp:Transcript_3721/g.7998  ORF Transcript_3721/g.7998 Transcript_3721/m.7998 type:complete len:258 (-) Transcript_3721:1774-2547(-)
MKPGTQVRIKGLVKAAKHNGKIGIVTKASAAGEGQRVGVKLRDGGGVLAVKIENLEEIKKSPFKKTITIAKPTTKSTTTTTPTPSLPKERTLKRDNALLREVDGNLDPNILVLYYHFADRAFDCFNASEYNVQMLRYYEKGLSVRLIAPRMVGSNEYFLVGLQHAEHDKNSLCEVAFNCGRSFTGISMLVKKRCFACHKPLLKGESGGACPNCLCVCFCVDSSCVGRHSAIRSDHEILCKKIDLAKVVVEKERIQLL